MAKLTEYSESTRFDANDILIKDGTRGTKKIKVENAAVEFAGLVSAKQHRNIWRGKNLGTSVSSEQKAAIKNGSFDDLYIGDYWVINGITWRIADMDYFFHCGDTDFTQHHLVIVPDTNLVSGEEAKMNDSNTTEGGYVLSKMYTDVMPTVKEKVTAAFQDMVLKHREYLVNAVTDGHPSAGGWFDSTVELMNEIMVYGCPIYTPKNDGKTIPTLYTVANSQFSMFRLNPEIIKRRINYWLRDVVSATDFAGVGDIGIAYYTDASSTFLGVRPEFIIG